MKHWIIDSHQTPPMILPEGVDISGWHDITELADPCRHYLNPETGETIGGSATWEQYKRDMHLLMAKGSDDDTRSKISPTLIPTERRKSNEHL